MSDDIIPRLRAIEAQVQRTLPDYLIGFPSIHAEAADEIERLREMVDTFHKLAKRFYEQVDRSE